MTTKAVGKKKRHAGISFKGIEQNAFHKSLQVMPIVQIMSKICMIRNVRLPQIKPDIQLANERQHILMVRTFIFCMLSS